ncbi:MAG: hypothetical protein WAP35_07345 [Solirubrobacterales bacterium]
MSKSALLKRYRGGDTSGGGSFDGEHSTAPPDIEMSTIMRIAWLRRAATTALFVFLLLGAASVFGVRDGDISATGGGYKLTVHHAEMTRPGLDTPWSVRVERSAGFDGPIELRTTAAYFELFDENGYTPAPDAIRKDGKYVVMEFARPEGNELVVSFDGRTSPAVQSGSSAETAILEDGAPVVAVNYRTRVMP